MPVQSVAPKDQGHQDSGLAANMERKEYSQLLGERAGNSPPTICEDDRRHDRLHLVHDGIAFLSYRRIPKPREGKSQDIEMVIFC